MHLTPEDRQAGASAAGTAGRPLVPPHVAWPALVVLLLTMSVSLCVAAVVAANSDGGVQLVEEYSAGR